MKQHVAVLMACHNRKEKTLASLECLSRSLTDATFTVYLVDDGSSDGTADAVLAEFSQTVVIRSDGNLFWASMCLSERHAVQSRFDYLLWLNDDTLLTDGSVDRMLKLSEMTPEAIIVGATVDPSSGELTYGGLMRRHSHPMRFSRVPISDEIQRLDNFTGNCVLIPADVRAALGPIDGHFPHAYADHDYGQRAMSKGVSMLQVPSFVGFCEENPPPQIPAGVIQRWRYYESPKVLPWRAQYAYMRRHGNASWPAWLAASLVRRLVSKKPV